MTSHTGIVHRVSPRAWLSCYGMRHIDQTGRSQPRKSVWSSSSVAVCLMTECCCVVDTFRAARSSSTSATDYSLPRLRTNFAQYLRAFSHAGPDTIRHDTIRDAILTCARKPTWVDLIYRTETTAKNCKTEKLKSTNRYARTDSKSLGNHVVSLEEERERLQWEGFAEKKVLSLEWKREWVMKN